MEIIAVGLNFRTACVEELERAFIGNGCLAESLKEIVKDDKILEGVLLSTCNRVEVYGTTELTEEGRDWLEGFIQEKSSVDKMKFQKLVYSHQGDEAVRHLFSVACGIDSMVVGEPQILGQVKRAYEAAKVEGSTGKVFNQLFPRALKVGKRARTETDLSKSCVSIGSVGVRLALEVLNGLSGKAVFLVGAGEIGEQIGESLLKWNPRQIYVYNRTGSRAETLARKLEGISVNDLTEGLREADVVISSTSSPDYVVRKDHVSTVMKEREKRPLLLIDLAVPRDIEPDVGSIPGVHLYNIDHLERIAEQNRTRRKKEIDRVLQIVEKEVSAFRTWLSLLKLEPVISELKTKIEILCEDEILKSMRKWQDERLGQDNSRLLARALTKKILHDPISVLKESALTEGGEYAEAARRLFRLGQGQGV